MTSGGLVVGRGERRSLSHGVVKHHVLFGQLQQHRIVEELADTHVLAQTLAPSGLDHELSGQMGGGLRLERPDHNTLVQGVTRHNLPVVEHRQSKGLPLCVCEGLSQSRRSRWLG